MVTIFDLVRANEVASYWNETNANSVPFLGETLFPNNKKLGLTLSWLKGSKGIPVSLKLSAFDAKAVPRARMGLDKATADMPFFKESMYVDEKLRQELNKVIESGNQAYIDAVMNRVFNDEVTLIEAAAVARERMRMMLLTTGTISIASNGQAYDYNYGIDSAQKKTVTKDWSDPTADIIGDITAWQEDRETTVGVKPTRAICDRKTWGYMLKNTAIVKSIFALSDGSTHVSNNKLRDFLMDELELEVVVYSKKYKDETGAVKPYVPADTFVLFPEGDLGNTWFGTTPEESDLMASGVENVAIVDDGVAVTTMKSYDPVNVETKVTQICLPDFPTADQIIIADLTA